MKYVWLALIAQYFFIIYLLIRIESLVTKIEKVEDKIHYLMRKESIRSGRKAI